MASPEFVSIAKYILSHHERWDGTGYPNNLKGEEIPLLSRIISIVDAFDAMTNERSYRKALTKEEAIQEIRKCSGTQFDPLVVMVFLEIFSEVDEYKQMNFD
jgi:HD-GYP domain-containing protein (c-di-GMP phosphodiesterase class II)